MDGIQDENKPDGPDIVMRACESCGHVKPLSPKHFPRMVGTQHRFQPICKSCFSLQRSKRKLERMERRSVNAFVQKANAGGSNIPHTSEMLESIMSLFGGSHGLASTMAQQYYAAPPGGRIRTSILEMIMRLVVKTAETGGTTKPVSLMTDDEIEAALSQRLENVVSAHRNLTYIKENQDAASLTNGSLLGLGNTLTEADIAAATAMVPHER